jgi:glycosyltransferase involved in cell wall biosynthesis
MVKRELKKIVLINQTTAYLFIDIANAFAEIYDEVVLIAGTVHPLSTPVNPKIKIEKIIAYNKKSTLSRAYTLLAGAIQIAFLILLKYIKHYLFLTTNPPFTTFVTNIVPNRHSIWVLDIFPEGMVSPGVIKSDSYIYRFWAKHNNRFFKKTEVVFTITQGMSNLLKKYCPPEKINLVHLWAHPMNQPSYYTNNPFIKKNHLEGKFIVMYSGNLGKVHDVELIVEAANILKIHENIAFVIIGEGWKKLKLEQMIAKYDLDNCLILPFQTAEMLPHSLSSAKIGIVSLASDNSHLSVPSKTYNLMALGIPMLCFADHQSELASLVKQYNIGVCCEKDEIEKITNFILTLRDNDEEWRKYHINALNCANNFAPTNASIISNKVMQHSIKPN